MNKSFWQAAAIRSLRTFAQSMVSMIAVGAAISEVSWLRALSVSAVAALLSILTSIATGLPEAQIEQKQPPDEEPDKWGVSGLFSGTKGAEEAEDADGGDDE